MAVGGLALGFFSSRISRRNLVCSSLILIGAAFSGMGLAPRFLHIMALMFVIGIALVPAESTLMTIMQLAITDSYRGRVSSALNALTTAASLISMAGAAGLGELIGLRTIYVVAGLITISAGLVGFFVLVE